MLKVVAAQERASRFHTFFICWQASSIKKVWNREARSFSVRPHVEGGSCAGACFAVPYLFYLLASFVDQKGMEPRSTLLRSYHLQHAGALKRNEPTPRLAVRPLY